MGKGKLVVNLSQTRDTWENRTSVKESPPSDLYSAYLYDIVLNDNKYERFQATVEGAAPGHVCKKADCEQEKEARKQHSSWSLLKFLLWLPS